MAQDNLPMDDDDNIDQFDPAAAAGESDSAAPSPALPAAPAAAPAADPEASPAPLNPVVVQYLANKQKLAQAQDQASTGSLISGLARAAGTMAHGLTGSGKPMDESGFNTLDQQAQAPVQRVLEQQKAGLQDVQTQDALLKAQQDQDANDPTSSRSKRVQEMIKTLYPGKFAPDVLSQFTAADQDSIFKPMELNQKADALKMQREQSILQRQDKIQDSAMGQTTGQLISMRGDPAAQQAERDVYAASKLNTLLSKFGDPNNLTPQMAALAVSEVGKIGSGGTPDDAMMHALNPSTLHGALASAWQKVSGSPTPAGVGAFLKQYQDYANGVSQDAKKAITDRYGRVIDAQEDRIGGTNANRLRQIYIHRFDNAVPGDREPQGQDPKVATYAQQNKIDYQTAAAILKKRGYGN